MPDILIETLLPTGGPAPSNGVDPESHACFTGWEPEDEALFSFHAPDTINPAENILLCLRESTPSAGLRHRWETIVRLFRPGLDSTGQACAEETSVLECIAPAAENQLTQRSLAVTGASLKGCVASVPINRGDLLVVLLRRVPATVDDDPFPVKLFGLSIHHVVNVTRVSACCGRVGEIIDTVRDLFNEATGGFLTDEFILRSMNRCLQDIGQENYWQKSSSIPASAGVFEVDLASAIPGFQDIHDVRYSGRTTPMTALGSFREFLEAQASGGTEGAPEYYVAQNTRLHVWPPPPTDLASGFRIVHSYLPEPLSCTGDNPDPPIPRAHDMAFVYFVLRQAFLRDRHAPGADQKVREYSQLYQEEKQRLLGEGEPPRLSLTPVRSR